MVNPNLMTDMIHKNHLGYAIWGKIVGDKIKELGWPNEKAVDDSLSSFKLNYQFNKRVLQILKERYEARLAAISGDLDSNLESLRVNKEARITAANRNIASLTDQVAEIERIEQEAERERLRLIAEAERQRQEALAEYNRQQAIIAENNRLQRETEDYRLLIANNARLAEEKRQRDAAQAAWNAQQAENARQEVARLAAEAAAAAERARQEQTIALLAACLFFGMCHR